MAMRFLWVGYVVHGTGYFDVVNKVLAVEKLFVEITGEVGVFYEGVCCVLGGELGLYSCITLVQFCTMKFLFPCFRIF
jgi:hypothetical protein